MRYIKSDHAFDMPDMLPCVIFADGPLGIETTMGFKAIDDTFIVTAADLLSLYPYRTYGMICEGDKIDVSIILEKQEIMMHPAAYLAYIEMGVIDADGNFIEEETDDIINPEDVGFSSN